jgi:hypothetical protein
LDRTPVGIHNELRNFTSTVYREETTTMNYADVQLAVAHQQEREFAESILSAGARGPLGRIFARLTGR